MSLAYTIDKASNRLLGISGGAATGKEIRAFKGHGGPVSSVAFSTDGARVLTGSWDETVLRKSRDMLTETAE